MHPDMVGMAIGTIGIKGEDHLRLHRAYDLHNSGGHSVRVGLPQAVGMLIVRRAHHAAVAVAEFVDVLEAEFVAGAVQFRVTGSSHRAVLLEVVVVNGAPVAFGRADVKNVYACGHQFTNERTAAKRFVVRMGQRQQ